MLDLTAAAEVDGVKFDGFDLFLFDPHINIDASDDDLKRLADKARARNLVIGSVVAPVWPPTGGGSAMGSADERKKFLEQVRKGCRIAKRLRELGIRPYGVVRIDSARPAWLNGPTATRKPTPRRSPRPSPRPARSPRISASGWPPRAKSAGAACTVGGGCCNCWKWSDRPQTLGFQADMAHTLLYMLGYNAPEDAILPADFDWKDTDEARRGAQEADRRAAPLDDRLSRRPERRHGPRLRLARQDGPPLPAERSGRQARHRQARPASGCATARAI